MRDDFKPDVKELLAKRVGMRCSNPNCRQPTSGPQEDPNKALNIGVAAHIAAASELGPRYDPLMSPQERRSEANGIWLCQNCAKLVDNDAARYSVDLLRRWRRLAEATALLDIEAPASNVKVDQKTNIFARKSRPLPSSIPSPKGFIGRENYLQELRECYKNGKRVFVLHGLGGVGKTALAQKFAEEIKSEYDAHISIDLRGAGKNPMSGNNAMLQVVRSFIPEVTPNISVPELENLYVSLLNKYRVLLLLDNAKERIQVERFNKSKSSCLLVTSRTSFVMTGGKEAHRLERMFDKEARELLFSIAGEERFDGHADELSHLAGYLPMALLPLAGLLAESEMETAAELVKKYQDRKARLALADPNRENLTVFASFDLSYEALSESLRKYWLQTAVFPADFNVKGAMTVWSIRDRESTAWETLKQISKYNLIEWDKTKDRFYLHDLARDYVNEKISKEELHRISKLHARFYASELEDIGWLKNNYGYEKALERVDLEWRNIITGQNWSVRFARANDDAARLSLDYFSYVSYVHELIIPRVSQTELLRWFKTAFYAARRLNHRPAQGEILSKLGDSYRIMGKNQIAVNCYNNALLTAKEFRNSYLEGNILTSLGVAELDNRNLQNAISYHEQALQIAEEIHDQSLKGRVLSNLGTVYLQVNLDDCFELFDKALAIADETNDLRAQVTCLGNLGKAYKLLQNLTKAIDYLDHAVNLARKISDKQSEGLYLSELGLAYLASGSREKCCESLQEGVRILEEINSKEAELYRKQLEIHCEPLSVGVNQISNTISLFISELNNARKIGDILTEADLLCTLGDTYIAWDEQREAHKYFREALEVTSQISEEEQGRFYLSRVGVAYAEIYGHYENAWMYSSCEKLLWEAAENPEFLQSVIEEKEFLQMLENNNSVSVIGVLLIGIAMLLAISALQS